MTDATRIEHQLLAIVLVLARSNPAIHLSRTLDVVSRAVEQADDTRALPERHTRGVWGHDGSGLDSSRGHAREGTTGRGDS